MGDSVLSSIIREGEYDKAFKVYYEKWEKPKKIKKYNSISICTNAMNRCSDIITTYKQNIEDSLDYKKVEFVLLNYNSMDNIDDYVKNNLMEYIERGILNYYKTIEPKYYDMCHSRNITFKLAKGDYVCSVDADHFIHKGFPDRINMLANIFPKKTVFCKSKYKCRGRLCFRKDEFINLLGGYDEDLKGYGFDDKNLLCRAIKLGFIAVKFGGEYCSITKNHKRHQSTNYKDYWRWTQRKNTLISLLNIKLGILKANEGKHWGKAHLLKNFKEEIDI